MTGWDCNKRQFLIFQFEINVGTESGNSNYGIVIDLWTMTSVQNFNMIGQMKIDVK